MTKILMFITMISMFMACSKTETPHVAEDNSMSPDEHSMIADPESIPNVINEMTISEITGTGAKIALKLDVEGAVYIDYGYDKQYGTLSSKTTSYSKEQVVNLTDLDPETKYYLNIIVIDKKKKIVVHENYKFWTIKDRRQDKRNEAAILEAVYIAGKDYLLRFKHESVQPQNGYKILVNEKITNTNTPTAKSDYLVTGLDTSRKQCFKIISPFTNSSKISNEICVNPRPIIPNVGASPKLGSVRKVGEEHEIKWSMPRDATDTPQGGFDIIVDGDDGGEHYSRSVRKQSFSGLDLGSKHCFQVKARWTQLTPPSETLSEKVCSKL